MQNNVLYLFEVYICILMERMRINPDHNDIQALPTVYQCFPLWTLITIVATLGQTLPSLTDSAFVVMDLTCKLGYENN